MEPGSRHLQTWELARLHAQGTGLGNAFHSVKKCQKIMAAVDILSIL